MNFKPIHTIMNDYLKRVPDGDEDGQPEKPVKPPTPPPDEG